MINVYYKIMIYVGTFIGGIFKIHQIWVSEVIYNPTEIIKIIGIILVIGFVLMPNDLLQNEDR